MRTSCIYILLLFLCLQSYAQEESHIKITDTPAINRLIEASHKTLNPDSAIVLYDEILRRSINANYTDGAFIALITKGIKYYEKEDYVKYRNVTISALPWASKSTQKDAVAWCYVNIGESYLSEGDYITASEYYYSALRELKKATRDEPNHSAANIYNSLGKVHIRLNQPEKALEKFRQAAAMEPSAHAWTQIAYIYAKQSKWKDALLALDTAEKINATFPAIWMYRGQIMLATNQPAVSIPMFQRALELDSSQTPARQGLLQAQRMLAGK